MLSVWPQKEPKSLFKYGEKLIKRKWILKVLLKVIKVVFYIVDASTSCFFTKQNLTVQQAYRASLCLFCTMNLSFDS